MGKTLRVIILPIRLDGVGFLLWHEIVFQTPNAPACNSIFFLPTQQGGRQIVLEQWVVWTGSSHWGGGWGEKYIIRGGVRPLTLSDLLIS